MQMDEDVGKVAQATPVLISKALELFMQSLIDSACQETRSRSAKRITVSHLKKTIMTTEQFDFLKDVVANIPDPVESFEQVESMSSNNHNGSDNDDGNMNDDEVVEPQPKKRKTRKKKNQDDDDYVAPTAGSSSNSAAPRPRRRRKPKEPKLEEKIEEKIEDKMEEKMDAEEEEEEG